MVIDYDKCQMFERTLIGWGYFVTSIHQFSLPAKNFKKYGKVINLINHNVKKVCTADKMRNCWNQNLYLEKLISGRGLLSLPHFHWALAHFPSRTRIYFAENFFQKYIRLYTPGLSYFFLWGLVTVHFLSGGRTINSKCCIKLNLTFSQSIKKFSMVISVYAICQAET